MSGGDSFEKDWDAEERRNAKRNEERRRRAEERKENELDFANKQVDALIGRVCELTGESRAEVRQWAQTEAMKPYKEQSH